MVGYWLELMVKLLVQEGRRFMVNGALVAGETRGEYDGLMVVNMMAKYGQGSSLHISQ